MELDSMLKSKPVLVTETGVSVIHFASLGNNSIVLNSLLKRLPKFHVSFQNLNGEYPLHWAVRSGNLENVKALVSYGANPNALDHYGNSVLHFAVEVGCYEIVKYLIVDCKVRAELVNKDGDTPLSIACREKFFNIVKLLLENSASVCLLKKLATSYDTTKNTKKKFGKYIELCNKLVANVVQV